FIDFAFFNLYKPRHKLFNSSCNRHPALVFTIFEEKMSSNLIKNLGTLPRQGWLCTQKQQSDYRLITRG
ncbi:MAG: hypothetical protein V7K68_09755, partial [Nostoc sp.]|uniref:hypothetical protein n=1 Tax=Nostoc sp. TaxID=1180 RepID=UPI002FFB2C35